MDLIADPFKSAMMIFETAVYAVPAVLGTGALASFAYGVLSTGHYWMKEGAGLLKTGISIVGGAVAGGIGGVIAAGKLTSAGALKGTEGLKLVGEEAIKGAVRGSTGSRGILQTFNRALFSEEVAGSFLQKKGALEKTIIQTDQGRLIIEKSSLDKAGEFAKITTEKHIDMRMKATSLPEKKEKEKEPPLIILPSPEQRGLILSTSRDAPVEEVERNKRRIESLEDRYRSGRSILIATR